jgi:hypothetical protein
MYTRGLMAFPQAIDLPEWEKIIISKLSLGSKEETSRHVVAKYVC